MSRSCRRWLTNWKEIPSNMSTIEVKGSFVFEQDTKRTHRFKIITEGGDIELSGSIYIPKDGPGIPHKIVLINPNHPGEGSD